MLIRGSLSFLVFVLCSGLLPAVAPGKVAAQSRAAAGDAGVNSRTAHLRIGEGINFAKGGVTRLDAEVDMGLRYLPPQSPHGWQYNVITGRIEYQSKIRTTQNYPLLVAARIASFDTRPEIARMTVGDINRWTEDEYQIAPGRYTLARGRTDGENYLIRILKFVAPSDDPATWVLSFTYEPVAVALGAAETAGKNLILSGTLSYRDLIFDEKIIDLDLASGRVAERFDRYGMSRNPKGEYAYLDQAGQIVIADLAGTRLATLPAPQTYQPSYGGGGASEVVISPSGDFIAVQVERSQPITAGGITVEGVARPCVAVIDRRGKEVAAFHRKHGAAWTPDNRLVVAENVEPGLHISDRSFRSLQPIPNTPDIEHMADTAVSPDGRTLAFTADSRVWLINMDGGALRRLTDSGLGEITPAWSPDGKYVAIQQIDPTATLSDTYRVVAVRVADGRSTIITDRYGLSREPNGRMSWR